MQFSIKVNNRVPIIQNSSKSPRFSDPARIKTQEIRACGHQSRRLILLVSHLKYKISIKTYEQTTRKMFSTFSLMKSKPGLTSKLTVRNRSG